jgi:hypothetical protein
VNTKLKLTKLTVSNLDRIRGGDPVCFCQVFPGGCSDEAFHDGGIFTATMVKTQCGPCSG